MLAFKFADALPALVVALGGIGFAWLGYHVGWWLPIVISATVFALAVLGDLATRRWLLPDSPVAATWLMESWIFVPSSVGALIAALLVLAAVSFEPSEGASLESKKLLAAALGAITAFATAAILKQFEDADEGIVGGHVRDAFEGAYGLTKDGAAKKREGRKWLFHENSSGANAAFSTEGWSRKQRQKNAEKVEAAIAS